MKLVADTHTHTNAVSHAYSTLYENISYAKKIGLSFLCLTEHGPTIPDAPHYWFFKNLKVVPDVIDGVVLLKGAEVNIVDYDGALDLGDELLERLDWVIASYHPPCCEPATPEDHTRGWLAVAKNPLIDVIGHCGDGRYPFDYETVIKSFAENGKIVEINSHSPNARPGSEQNCREIAKVCKKHGVRVVAGSDAHFFTQIGACDWSLQLLRSIDYPEELIMNTDYDRFLALAREKTGRQLI